MSETLFFTHSRIHNIGAFAKTPFAAGSRVIEYVGEKITKMESLRRCEQGNSCIFSLDDQFDLDGNFEWNPARFINHSCAPNCEAEFIDGRIWIVAVVNIATGEEITFNYGHDLDSCRQHPCNCGAENCVKYIVSVEFMARVRGWQGNDALPPQG